MSDVQLIRLTNNNPDIHLIYYYYLALISYLNIYNGIYGINVDLSLSENEPYEITRKHNDKKEVIKKEDYATLLQPENLLGKPIQLDTGNFYPLINNDYYISTKADGLRFGLFISDKSTKLDIGQKRTMFFVDIKKQFWILKNGGSYMNQIEDIDNCLIDGELIFHGIKSVTPNVYTASKVIFITFDILFGPINPKFNDEFMKNVKGILIVEDKPSELNVLDINTSNAMTGYKAKDRWSTINRRCILDIIFNCQPMSRLNQHLNVKNFCVLVSPFISIDTMFQHENPVAFMIKTFEESLEHQYVILKGHKMPKIGTDGLIFTPKYLSYVQGNWDQSINKQYKWKPIDKLTVDLFINLPETITATSGQIGPKVDKYIEKNKVYATLSNKDPKKPPIPFLYEDKKCVLELVFNENNHFCNIGEFLPIFKNKQVIFKFIKYRHDKDISNSYLTVKSTINVIQVETEKNISLLNCIKQFRMHNFSSYDYLVKYMGSQLFLYYNYKCNSTLQSAAPKVRSQRSGIFNKTDLKSFNAMVSKAKSDNIYELETQLVFTDKHPSYALYLINSTIGPKYDVTPVIKRYDKDGNRVSSIILGITIIDVEIIKKEEISKFSVDSGFKELNKFKVILSKENPIQNYVSNTNTLYHDCRYQMRYIINNISIFWIIEIIEYTEFEGNLWKEAEDKYARGPYNKNINPDGYKTRVEIEFKPLVYIKEIFKMFKVNSESLEKRNEFEEFLVKYLVPVQGSYQEKCKEYQQQIDFISLKIKDVDNKIIIDDYFKILFYVLYFFVV